jgi:hypothetical protein
MFALRTANYVMDIDIPDIVISHFPEVPTSRFANLPTFGTPYTAKSAEKKREKETYWKMVLNIEYYHMLQHGAIVMYVSVCGEVVLIVGKKK